MTILKKFFLLNIPKLIYNNLIGNTETLKMYISNILIANDIIINRILSNSYCQLYLS